MYLKHLINSFPFLVSEYSTLGGISLNLVLEISSKFCNSFNCFDSILGLIGFKFLISSLNLFFLFRLNSLNITKVHFLLIWLSVFVIGHFLSIFHQNYTFGYCNIYISPLYTLYIIIDIKRLLLKVKIWQD